MDEIPDKQIHTVDVAMPTPIVRRALGRETVQLGEWTIEQIRGGIGRGTEVHRFSGQAQDGNQTIPWSLILKVLHPVPEEEQNPSHRFYWKREVEAYRSGWLENLPGGIAAPRCNGVEKRPDGFYWLWLEEVKDDIGRKWPLEHCGVVARHLGQFNGAYLSGEPMPTYPWLSQGGIRKCLEFFTSTIEQLPHYLEHPLIGRWMAQGVGEEILRWWGERERFLDIMERLPQTICHYDAFRRNILARRLDDSTFESVLIDWAYVGRGPIGAEIELLVINNLIFVEVDLAKAHELEQIVLEGYIEGLRDAGWHGDPRLAQMGYLAASIRNGIGSVGESIPALLRDDVGARAEATFGYPIETLLDYENVLWRHWLVSMPKRTLGLARELGL